MPGHRIIPTSKVAGQYRSIGRVQMVIRKRIMCNVIQAVCGWMLIQQVPSMLMIFKIIVGYHQCVLFKPGQEIAPVGVVSSRV